MDCRKCPNCGAQLQALVSVCDYCGSEIVRQSDSGIREFLEEYHKTDSYFKQSELVNSLVVPNTKSEVLGKIAY